MSDIEAAHRVSEAFSVALSGTTETTVEHMRAAWEYGRAWVARSARTSRRNCVVSSAFSTSSAISSTSNGLLA